MRRMDHCDGPSSFFVGQFALSSFCRLSLVANWVLCIYSLRFLGYEVIGFLGYKVFRL